ncbi:hypothetical protein FISHEDRAFT_54993 [Fistulina hepatica ATCC 64428]|uniref:Uncharacterized protein n=1 Tax=Fistulina hepatica ATCC 64428 TaxID=1128425 RepID=A0A0D7AQE2_9AGAR|nr:hypothetical protein FISHEDRAFT_54993 [Fistulina hepatica ATCC 64428]
MSLFGGQPVNVNNQWKMHEPQSTIILRHPRPRHAHPIMQPDTPPPYNPMGRLSPEQVAETERILRRQPAIQFQPLPELQDMPSFQSMAAAEPPSVAPAFMPFAKGSGPLTPSQRAEAEKVLRRMTHRSPAYMQVDSVPRVCDITDARQMPLDGRVEFDVISGVTGRLTPVPDVMKAYYVEFLNERGVRLYGLQSFGLYEVSRSTPHLCRPICVSDPTLAVISPVGTITSPARPLVDSLWSPTAVQPPKLRISDIRQRSFQIYAVSDESKLEIRDIATQRVLKRLSWPQVVSVERVVSVEQRALTIE